MKLHVLEANTMKFSVYQGPALQVPYSNQPVRQRTFVWRIFSLLLVQSGYSYFTHRESLGKGSAVTLIDVSRSKVKVIAKLYIKSMSVAYLLSPWSNLAHTSLTGCL